MTVSPLSDCDVLVIGGGPAGSTAATLLARQGWSVQLLEKARHPRFHIGESLLPMNLPVLERLGVLADVERIGVRKLAADFASGGDHYGSFPFSRALDAKRTHAFQVRRSEFDELLFRNAAANGAVAVEETEVTGIERHADGHHSVRVRHAGAERTLQARYVVDASGRDTLLGKQYGLKQANPRHRSAAMFAHFSGVQRRPGEDAGNITIYRLPRGWMWMIPLQGDIMSIGAVCDPEHFKTRRGALDEFLLQTLHAHAQAEQRMRGATRVSDVEATGNYSYACRAAAGPGWVLTGDAYAFVDPIFSSGVFLAMHGAERAVAMVDGALREPRREAALQRAYRRHLDWGIAQFSWFIERFTGPAMVTLFRNPRNILGVEQAVISMLAGDVFDNPRVLVRLRLFRIIHAATSLAHWLRGRWRRPFSKPGVPNEAMG